MAGSAGSFVRSVTFKAQPSMPFKFLRIIKFPVVKNLENYVTITSVGKLGSGGSRQRKDKLEKTRPIALIIERGLENREREKHPLAQLINRKFILHHYLQM